MLVKHDNTITYGTKSLKTLNQRHLIPNVKNILTVSSDRNVYVICAQIFETSSV